MLGRIGKYTVEKELGHGGFGYVYLAFDPDVGQPVAIKKLRAEGDPDLLRRFQMEIRTTAGLRHKNIVTIHASGEEDGSPYLVMEFLEGHTLKQVIQERWPLSLLDKVRIMTQVAEGLAYAHSKGVVHRDVKPENIMLLPDDNVKIMDFGIALGPNRDSNVTQTGGIIGTPPYFAPEQLEGYKANEQTDIFSFGDVYYELLAGIHPFEQFRNDWKTLRIAIMSYEPRSIGELLAGCPEALETLVHRTLAKAPEFRYQKFEEVQLDSEAILVDLKHEGAAVILQEVPALMEAGNLQTALAKIQQAYKLEPGNREVRRLREEINLRVQKDHVQRRVAGLLAEAENQMRERRYPEAIQNLEACAKLDGTNVTIAGRLEEARVRLDASARANRLVSEARFQQQKGLLTEAQARLQEAIALDPDHTDARRLNQRVSDELERRQLDQVRQQAIRAAGDHRAAKRFAEALAALDAIEREQPGAGGVPELRAEIQHEQAEEDRRLRAEKFNMALARTRDAMQGTDLESAGQMLDHLCANFANEPGAADVLPGLRARLAALVRAKETTQYQQRVRALLKEKSFRAALDLLDEALHKFPEDAGLERLRKSADDLFRAHRRAESIAAVLSQATAKRDQGEAQGALDIILEGRKSLGDEAAFADLAHQLEMEIEQQRYAAALEALLKDGGEMIAAGKYAEAIGRLESATEFGGEAEVRALLDSARAAAAIQEERRYVEDTLAATGKLQSEGAWSQALGTLEQGLARYPHNSSLVQTADRLRDRVELERARAAIEKHRGVIRQEIDAGQFQRAGEALRQARAEFPGERAFDDLADRLDAGLYEEGWRAVEERVNQDLSASALVQAQGNLENEGTRTVYAKDPRWNALLQEVAKRREYEDALVEAERRRKAGSLLEAEELLTAIIGQGPRDKRAQQLRGAIQLQRSEALRQQEIARITQEIREQLTRDDLAQAASALAAARSRYPGENAWTELQAGLDARQQALRRKVDIAAAEEGVRQALSRGDIRQAVAMCAAARAKFPGEAVWAALDAEINARAAILRRQQEVAAIADGIRRRLNRGRSEELPLALAEVAAARAKYPDEALWDTLQAEVAIAERVHRHIERGELAQAEAQLIAARAQYPDEDRWRPLQDLLKSRAEVTRIVESVRSCMKRDDLGGAIAELNAARATYPNEPDWAALQTEIAARQAVVQRQAEIADAAVSVRRSLAEDIREPEAQFEIVRKAAVRLDAARTKYPGEGLWNTLQAEIDARGAQLQREIAESVRNCSSLDRLDWYARAAAEARARYPGDDFWEALKAAIDTRRKPLEEASRAEFQARIREALKQGDLAAAQDRLRAARDKHPPASLWADLQAEIDARQALIARQAEIAAAGERVRVCVARDDLRQAGVELNAARAKYPGEALWLTLEAAIEEARNRDRDKLLAIRQQIEAEPRKGKRKELDRQAQGIAAGYAHDQEIAALAATIHSAQLASQKPIPWKLIGGVGGAAIAVAAVLLLWPHKNPPTPTPASPATIPVEIRTDPPGASVRVGEHTCVTPDCRLDLAPGSYRVAAQLKGYEPKQQTAVVDSSNRTVDLTLRPLAPPPPPAQVTGTLVVQATLADVLVYVDREARGRTDATGSVTLPLEARSYEVRVERNGYATPGKKQVKITAGARQTVVFRLVPEIARLELGGAPANLELRMDDKLLGRTDGSLVYLFPVIQPGDHVFSVAQGLLQGGQGAAGRTLTQRFEPGQTARLSWKPDPPPPPAPSPAPTVVKKAQPTPEEIEDRDWEKVRNASDAAQLRDFLKTYPNGRHANDAQSALDRLAWANTKRDSLESLRAYVRDFPNGTHAAEANSQINDLVQAQRQADQANARQDGIQAERRKQVLDVLSSLDQALEKKQEAQVKAIWPGKSNRELLESLKVPRQKISLKAVEDAKLQGDAATIRCSLITALPKPKSQNATLVLHYGGGRWIIEDLQVGQ